MITLMAVWYVWKDVLPALQQLDQTRIPGIPLTIDKLLAAILQIIVFTTAARNIPGLIEITLLERLPLDRSVRYATGSIIRYLIVVIGVIKVGNSLGIEWERAQWLVAALTFSLGFGLQEIFANFVSGIIMLFEQPVRVGDVVTLDNVTGTVNRIRIRSTSIIDWDRKEYIVPNKEFITGKLLNWTLTDTVTRVTLSIQTTHQADPQQVRETVLKILTTQPHVLTDPPPNVVFDGFGDSSLRYMVVMFLPGLEFRMETIHGVHTRIHKAFKENGIELAYPKRGLDITAIPPVAFTRAQQSELQETNGKLDPELEDASTESQ
jgi:potassium efflux system protein